MTEEDNYTRLTFFADSYCTVITHLDVFAVSEAFDFNFKPLGIPPLNIALLVATEYKLNWNNELKVLNEGKSKIHMLLENGDCPELSLASIRRAVYDHVEQFKSDEITLLKHIKNIRYDVIPYSPMSQSQHWRKSARKLNSEISKERTLCKKILSLPKDHELNKLRTYLFFRAKRMYHVLLHKERYLRNTFGEGLADDCRLNEEDFTLFRRVMASCRKKNRKEFQEYFAICFTEEQLHLFLMDMVKYPVGFRDNILTAIEQGKIRSFDEYIAFVKSTPKTIKKNRYLLKKYPEDGQIKTKIQNMFYENITASGKIIDIDLDNPDGVEFEFSDEEGKPIELDESDHKKLKRQLHFCRTLDLKVWYYFKEAYHINGRYTKRKLAHMHQVFWDGMDIYSREKNNPEGFKFCEIKGSAMKMMQYAIFNHHEFQKLSQKRMLEKKKLRPMAEPTKKLPEWVEDIRIKTNHDMIKTGVECHHCIGNYVDSSDIFVRDGSICAMIGNRTFAIIQCFDEYDTTTKESEAFRKKLDKALEGVRKK